MEEPTEPNGPLPPKPEQATRDPDADRRRDRHASGSRFAQQGAFLTTAQGARLRDTDHSLKAGERGPTLLQDHHLREKITHFDHERIPERVVHARGAGAHGVFVGYGNARPVTPAGFLAKGVETPVFVRFSTVLGSRGSADTVRDTRGFATKFYTDEGTFDLVGNNIPVFFIQDGIKFPDVIHAGKPHPDREIPQAQSAHDTFWDFVSLHTEAQHHTIWDMSDRGIPRSYRMMEGFGVHTFRLVNAAGETSLVKFHWKPGLGVHSLTWEEAQLLGGIDPDFHRRDLDDAIEAGAFPQWELGVQVFPDTADETFEGIDLLDPTKIVPEELAPVQPIGHADADRQPDELLRRDRAGRLPRRPPGARHRRHQRPAAAGAAVLLRRHPADPAGRTELHPDPDQPAARAGQRHAARRHPPARGARAAWRRTSRTRSTAAARSSPVAREDGAFVDVPAAVARGAKVRANPASFDDHFSQARLFWLSMTPVEKEHIVRGVHLRARQVLRAGDQGAAAAGAGEHRPGAVRAGGRRLGLPAPDADRAAAPTSTRARRCRRSASDWPTDGRMVGIVVDPDGDLAGVASCASDASRPGMVPLVIAPHGGTWSDGTAGAAHLRAPPGRSSSTPCCVAGCPAPAPDALAARDSKAGDARQPRRSTRGSAADRGVLPARQGDRRLGCGRRGARPGRDRAGRSASSRARARKRCSPRCNS